MFPHGPGRGVASSGERSERPHVGIVRGPIGIGFTVAYHCDNVPIMTGLFIKNSLPWHLRLRSALPGNIVLACACAILLLTAPTNGDFWWFEAPSHAMNGVFIRDFVAAMPWRDPVAFAIDYYMRYPAVTILFYPPLCFRSSRRSSSRSSACPTS
jgi:hypothetical protein